MGTTGTIMGVSEYLKEKNPQVQIVGAQPEEGSSIPGIRKWPEAYLPRIFDRSRVDQTESVSQADAENMARKLAVTEGCSAASRRRLPAGCGIAPAGERHHRLHRLRSRRPLPPPACSRPDAGQAHDAIMQNGANGSVLFCRQSGPGPGPLPTPANRRSAQRQEQHLASA
jgi:hypothetical protein